MSKFDLRLALVDKFVNMKFEEHLKGMAGSCANNESELEKCDSKVQKYFIIHFICSVVL